MNFLSRFRQSLSNTNIDFMGFHKIALILSIAGIIGSIALVLIKGLNFGIDFAGGILIENVIKGNTWEKAIVGIGINVNQVVFGNMKSTPVSLKQITGKSYAAIDLAKELCACLQIRYNQLQETCFSILLEEYNHKLYKVNQSVLFQNGTDQLEATVRGVAENGQLIIEHSKTELAEHGKLVWLL
jgi:BirA family biotin operon repressor/biotin-[acetyl-CoA-carboxylase] ligase